MTGRQGRQDAGGDDEVREEDSNSVGSYEDDAGPSSLGISIDFSQLSRVPIRLGLSINLSILQRQPSNPASSAITPGDTASWVGPFREPVGPTQPLPSGATAIDFLCKYLVMTFSGILLSKQICMFDKNVLHHTNGKTSWYLN